MDRDSKQGYMRPGVLDEDGDADDGEGPDDGDVQVVVLAQVEQAGVVGRRLVVSWSCWSMD